jgi:hypothetical protein
VATLAEINVNETMVEFGGSLESGVQLSWSVWQESGFSRRVDVYIFNLLCKIL